MNRIALAALLVVGLAACEQDPSQPRLEYFPDMTDSIAYDPFDANPVTRDGKTAMAPPPGTIPRGYTPLHYGPGPAQAARAGRELKNPFEPTAEVLKRGEVVFQRFCSPCHARDAKGSGPVVPPFPGPPSLLAKRARDLPDGHIFHIISHGQGLMPGHASQVAPEDRWKMILHIRALQQAAEAPAGGKGGVQ